MTLRLSADRRSGGEATKIDNNFLLIYLLFDKAIRLYQIVHNYICLIHTRKQSICINHIKCHVYVVKMLCSYRVKSTSNIPNSSYRPKAQIGKNSVARGRRPQSYKRDYFTPTLHQSPLILTLQRIKSHFGVNARQCHSRHINVYYVSTQVACSPRSVFTYHANIVLAVFEVVTELKSRGFSVFHQPVDMMLRAVFTIGHFKHKRSTQ